MHDRFGEFLDKLQTQLLQKIQSSTTKKISKSYKKVYDNDGNYKYVAVEQQYDVDEWEYDFHFIVLGKTQRDSIVRMLNIIYARQAEEQVLFGDTPPAYEISIGKLDIAIVSPNELSEQLPNLNEKSLITDIIFFNPTYDLDRKILFSILGSIGTQVHTLMQQDSVEKLVYNNQMASEKYAFKNVMNELANLTNFQDKPDEKIKVIEKSYTPDVHMVSENDKVFMPDGSYKYRPRILVDKRELRSLLPGALFFGGFNVIPMFLEHGDYIISDDIAIERKSIQDLLNSLKNRRLFKQIVSMKRSEKGEPRFSQIYILLEFDDAQNLNFLNYQLHSIRYQIDLFRENFHKTYAKLNLACLESLIIKKYPWVKFLHSFSPKQSVSYISWLTRKRKTLTVDKYEPNNTTVRKEYEKNACIDSFLTTRK